jgi:hypothetical protein
MVGPISEEERASFAFRMKLGLTILVAASTGLTALHGGASLPLVGLAVVAGAAVGAPLVWFVFPGSGGRSPDVERRFER